MVVNEKKDFQQLMDSQLEKLRRCRIPIKLYDEENVKSVDNKYLIIGRIKKAGIDYLVGVDIRYVYIGATKLFIKNGGRVILKLNRKTIDIGGLGRRTRMYRSGGPRFGSESGGPRLPRNSNCQEIGIDSSIVEDRRYLKKSPMYEYLKNKI